jgi:hypothetical protein
MKEGKRWPVNLKIDFDKAVINSSPDGEVRWGDLTVYLSSS